MDDAPQIQLLEYSSLNLKTYEVKRQVICSPYNLQRWNKHKITTVDIPVQKG